MSKTMNEMVASKTLSKTDLQAKVLEYLKAYSAIPSLTYEEQQMLDYIYDDFLPHPSQGFREVYVERRIRYSALLARPGVCPYLFIVHVDRVPQFSTGQPYTNTIVEPNPLGDDVLTGQLDNIISLSVLRVLHDSYPMNIIFTTEEEHGASAPEIVELLDSLHADYGDLLPISVDIDIFRDLKEFEDNAITLRTHCAAGDYKEDLVDKLRALATRFAIPWSGDDRGRTIVEAGFLSTETGGRLQGAHVGIPLINYHSNTETTTWDTVYNAYRLLLVVLEDAGLHHSRPNVSSR